MASSIAQIRKSVLTLALPVTVSPLLQRTEGIAAVFLVGGLGAMGYELALEYALQVSRKK